MSNIIEKAESIILKDIDYINSIKDFSFTEAYEGVQMRFVYKNGISASVISHKHSYGGDKGLWEIMLSYPNPFTNDVLGHLSVEEVIYYLKSCSKLPFDKESYSFNKKEVNKLSDFFDKFERNKKEKLSDKLTNILINKNLLDSNFYYCFSLYDFESIAFMPENKEQVMRVIEDFILENNENVADFNHSDFMKG